MNKLDILYEFIKKVEREKLLTLFISNLFGYDNLLDYNYIFRAIKEKEMVIIDIYDNISVNRFNRYIFDFDKKISDTTKLNHNNVFLTYININYITDTATNISKLAYLFTLDVDKIIEYGKTFLAKELVEILRKIIKK